MGYNTNENKRHLITGILAHVDAGKTTLSESMLYLSGNIRNLGRVDHKDAFLDNNDIERERGITIFSKQAVMNYEDMVITILDTPGHVDFQAEMERSIQVMDYAILVVSGTDGIQGHTLTLWKLLKLYNIPVFIFINKMDQEGTIKEDILEGVKKEFETCCIDFSNITNINEMDEEWLENIAMTDEELLNEYVETGKIDEEKVKSAIAARNIFPCYFGSALKLNGVKEFMEGFKRFTKEKKYNNEFGARVYKIVRDNKGNRLTYLKVTGGGFKVKDILPTVNEKVNQIRIYSGEKYEVVNEVCAGEVCTVTGLTNTYPGMGIGTEKNQEFTVLEPVLTYQIDFLTEVNIHEMLTNLKQLEEEDPKLHVVWNEKNSKIYMQLMGEVQIDILKRIIWDRFKVRAEFGQGKVVYKETISTKVEGVGHFEPLRHYAEVHLLLEPLERGMGLKFDTNVSEDVLDKNWQRLILTHLEEKIHKGVLTGSDITDMKITLITGRAHQKHTEGGDFRQATYRAVRQGLMKAKNVLLEPWYEVKMELPLNLMGRVLTDIQKMHGETKSHETYGDKAVVKGEVAVSAFGDYMKEFLSYTKGRGRITCNLKGYKECYNQDEIVNEYGYDPETDLDNPADSVFCAHGAGFVVPWEKVDEYMHLESPLKEREDIEEVELKPIKRRPYESRIELTEEELDAIYMKTPDPVKRNYNASPVTIKATSKATVDEKWLEKKKEKANKEEYLLVDGYNIIFAWDELKELAEVNIDSAREKLADILSNFKGYRNCTLILVFDAYKIEGHIEEVTKYHNIYIVYTKEAETADQYIEKTVKKMNRKYDVTVATSDGLEQIIILGQGAQRLSALGLLEEVRMMEKEIRQEFLKKDPEDRNYLFDHLNKELLNEMETIRLGKNEETEK